MAAAGRSLAAPVGAPSFVMRKWLRHAVRHHQSHHHVHTVHSSQRTTQRQTQDQRVPRSQTRIRPFTAPPARPSHRWCSHRSPHTHRLPGDRLNFKYPIRLRWPLPPVNASRSTEFSDLVLEGTYNYAIYSEVGLSASVGARRTRRQGAPRPTEQAAPAPGARSAGPGASLSFRHVAACHHTRRTRTDSISSRPAPPAHTGVKLKAGGARGGVFRPAFRRFVDATPRNRAAVRPRPYRRSTWRLRACDVDTDPTSLEYRTAARTTCRT